MNKNSWKNFNSFPEKKTANLSTLFTEMKLFVGLIKI